MKDLWLINYSKRDVSISDIGLVIRARTHVNLTVLKLNVPWTTVINSINTGSIYKRRNQLAVSEIPPGARNFPKIKESTVPIASDPKTTVKVQEKNFEELNIDNWSERAEFLEEERKPLLGK